MKRTILISLTLLSTVALAGCNRTATGQVVAVVNGEEVSLSELNGELQAGGGSGAGQTKEAIRAQALQNLIDRKLLAQAAKSRGIEKDPEFLQLQRRQSEQLMIGMLAKQVTKNIPVPSAADIDAYIAKHPEMFGQRTIYALNQIQFAAPADQSKLKTFEGDHSLQAVAESLNKLGMKFTQQNATLDSATTPPGLIKQVLALPPSEPFIVGANGRVIVSVIVDKKVIPLAGDDARKLASEALRRDAISDAAARQIKQARTAAKIEYQKGFEPPAPKK